VSRRTPSYPGLEDPRAALEKLKEVDDYILGLQRRFYVASPAYAVLGDIREAMRKATFELTGDPFFLSIGLGGQSAYKPPPAKPVPGR
jgi:hypothetical protein